MRIVIYKQRCVRKRYIYILKHDTAEEIEGGTL